MALHSGVDKRVVIIGCGISGVGAAQKLIKQGFRNVRIIEATSRSGGRIKTGRLDGKIIEIGANWIHGPSQENPVFRLASHYNLLDEECLSEENQSVDFGGLPPLLSTWLSSSGKKLEADLMAPAVEVFMTLLRKSQEFYNTSRAPMSSVGEFLKTEALRISNEEWKEDEARKLRQALFSTLLKLECGVNGTHTMDDVNLATFGMYKSLPGLDCTFPGGYEGLIRHMMNELPKDIVLFNKTVKCIHWNSQASSKEITCPVTVECITGETFEADHVILTIPLGYMKKHHDSLLNPPLPQHKLHSIQRLGFGTNNKIFVEFEKPFWDEDCEVVFLVWEDEHDLQNPVSDIKTSWIRKMSCFTVLKPAERYGYILCGWIAGHESEYMETLPEEEVLHTVTQLIHRFTGNPTIAIKKLFRSRWFHDPYTCGAYSYVAKDCSGEDIDNLAEPLPLRGSNAKPLQVLFAGEATHKSFFSTVHGALLTGWREADRLISHYNPNPSAGKVTANL
ncbi:peroxisomal N(1)-acetyl-spermine/spermidine oxidase [Tachysurus vachellii]|uniref:peroxisomal N(1)-acetyl-spermine/spermidine oxidase n=1 Tax=Tachysurus vachellii TaxID=175792 RepID=UPI00296B0F91|nr:peroxisomal N(1)-acetyl-spermine/spermidine oxidase [Tachysurus vachellii]